MAKEAAKEVLAKLAIDDDLRAKFDEAATAEDKFQVLADAGYKIVTPDDLIAVQSEVQQKGMLSDLGGWLGTTAVSVGINPAGISASDAQKIGNGIGTAADALLTLL